MVRVTLEQGGSLVMFGGVLLGSWILTVLFYMRAFREIAPGRRWLLLGLRMTAVAMIVLLLFRPVLSLEEELKERRKVAFFLDASTSMGTVDDGSGKSRFDQMRSLAEEWLDALGGSLELELHAFDETARRLDGPAGLRALKPEGQATSLTRALQSARGVRAGNGRSKPEAVLLFSDGVHNAAGDPEPLARSLGTVLHTIGVGNSLRTSPSYRDVRVVSVDCADLLPLNNRARVTAGIAQAGLTGRVVRAVLEQDGQPVDERDVELRGDDTVQEVAFEFLPTEKGRHRYRVRIPVQPGERIEPNNRRETIAQVVDARMRVLYLEGSLRAEYGAIVQRFLSRDPDVEFCSLVQTRPGTFLRRSNITGMTLEQIPTDPEVLQQFDVVMIGDLDAQFWKPEAMAILAERVRAGAGLILLGGTHGLGAGGYGSTPLGELSPVDLGERTIGQMDEPFQPILTVAGRNHPIFANIGDFFGSGAEPARVPGLPALNGCVRMGAAKPGATVLAVHPDQGGMPVLAIQPAGKGRVAVFAGDTTRNWQQTMRALDQETPFMRFWGQVVRWLAQRDEPVGLEASVRARTRKAMYEPDEPILIEATVRTKDGEGTDQAGVVAQVKGGERVHEPISLLAQAGTTGGYAATLEPLEPGTYTIEIEARVSGTIVKGEPLEVEIGRPNLEYDRLDLDEKMLERLASAAGGRYVHASVARSLLDQINREANRRKVGLERPLAPPWPAWCVFAGALCLEWHLRRRFHLR